MGLASSAISTSVRQRIGRDKLTADEVVTARAVVLAAVRDGGQTRESARAAGVSWALILKWSKSDAAFAEALAEARRDGDPVRIAAQQLRREQARKPKVAPPPPPPPKPPPPPRWTVEDDALLRRLAGTTTTLEIARRFVEQGMTPRSVPGLRARAFRLNLSLFPSRPITLSALREVFGANYYALRDAVRGGWLHLMADEEDAKLLAVAEVERFIKECAWAYNPCKLGSGRLADLARTVHRSDPWLTHAQVAEYLGLTRWELTKVKESGALPFRRRLFGQQHAVVYRRGDVVAYARDQLRRGA